MKPVSHKFTLYGKRLSGIGILTFRGIEDVYIAEGNVNSDVFMNFCTTVLTSYTTSIRWWRQSLFCSHT